MRSPWSTSNAVTFTPSRSRITPSWANSWLEILALSGGTASSASRIDVSALKVSMSPSPMCFVPVGP